MNFILCSQGSFNFRTAIAINISEEEFVKFILRGIIMKGNKQRSQREGNKMKSKKYSSVCSVV